MFSQMKINVSLNKEDIIRLTKMFYNNGNPYYYSHIRCQQGKKASNLFYLETVMAYFNDYQFKVAKDSCVVASVLNGLFYSGMITRLRINDYFKFYKDKMAVNRAEPLYVENEINKYFHGKIISDKFSNADEILHKDLDVESSRKQFFIVRDDANTHSRVMIPQYNRGQLKYFLVVDSGYRVDYNKSIYILEYKENDRILVSYIWRIYE
jgi:hypothetical protein